ncbi:hypothetical protein [Leyella stercorea]|uniref:hypothetical protein n=1 Tax=Leyella stercorea TaxID=363265 RepID=UPI00242DC1EE|nr:hypothetical protein [Leyella stercorea]
MPYFNRQNNDDLILAIQSAGVERGRNGFRKNKSMEKQPVSEEDLLDTVPTAPMPSTPSISAARSSHSTIYIQLRLVE